MTKYEEIKARVSKIFPYSAIAEAALKQQDYDKAQKYTNLFVEESLKIANDYPTMLASSVIYSNALKLYTTVYSCFKNEEVDILKVINGCLHFTYNIAKRNLDNENCCKMLLSNILFYQNVFYICLERLNNQLDGFDISSFKPEIYKINSITYTLFGRLMTINPNSEFVQLKQYRDTYDNLIKSGFKPSSLPLSSLMENIDTGFDAIIAKLNILYSAK